MDLKRLATRPLRYVHDNGRIIVGRPREGRLRRWSCGLQVCHWTIGSAREQGSSQVVLGQLGPLVRAAVHVRAAWRAARARPIAFKLYELAQGKTTGQRELSIHFSWTKPSDGQSSLPTAGASQPSS